jgi:hypothetical protein
VVDTPFINDGADESLRKTVSLLNKIEAKTGSTTITGPVTVSNEVEVTNSSGSPIPVSGSVSVSNLPATQPISGSVSVSNFPATQPVSGTFWQATQPVSGSVSVSNFPATQAVSLATAPTTPVTGTFWQATQPVSGTFWQATQPVSGTFWQATQPVSGTVNTYPLQGTSVSNTNFSSITSAELAPAVANREVLTVYNEGSGTLFINVGASCSATSYQVRLFSGEYWEAPAGQQSLQHSGIFSTAGTARVTQIS